MAAPPSPTQPSLPWRTSSSIVMGVTGCISRAFIFGANSTEVHGLDNFLQLLDERKDIEGRTRGLLTVSNHICVIDDPLIWGTLPFRYHFNPANHRWSLASHDICFNNKLVSIFFTLGQVLPTHRHAHSLYGGLFQPTITQAIRLLSTGPFSPTTSPAANPSPVSPDLTDPFTSPTTTTYTYSTNGHDTFPTPSAYTSRRYSWLHIFPEGRIHQHPQKIMRYFKWGIARLILEPEACPDIIPMWIEGAEEIMHESRQWPRFVPRANAHCTVTFGDNVGGHDDRNSVFHELRRKWRELVEEQREKGVEEMEMGMLSEELRFGERAVHLRMECASKVRSEVLKVRRGRGLPEEDPKAGLVETWVEEGGKHEGRMRDGSWVRDV